jgi:hypothetical protein
MNGTYGDPTKHEGGDEQDYNRLVSFRRHGVYPWTGVYVTLDDQIRVRLWSPTASTTINVSIRWQAPDGQIIPEFFAVTGQGSGSSPTTKTLNPAEGYLISLNVACPTGQRGSAFVVVDIFRGTGSQDVTQGAVLVSGYPGTVGSIGFPESVIASPLDGRGFMRAVVGGAPAAGAEVSDAVPAGREWILRSTCVLFTASAAAANRVPMLFIDDGGANIMARVQMGTAITASQAPRLTWAPGLQAGANAALNQTAGWVMECRMLPGWRIRTLTTALDAGDQYSAPVYMVEEFIDA